jgi:hypothetical protein
MLRPQLLDLVFVRAASIGMSDHRLGRVCGEGSGTNRTFSVEYMGGGSTDGQRVEHGVSRDRVKIVLFPGDHVSGLQVQSVWTVI